MKKAIVATALFAALIIIAGAFAGGTGATKVDLVVRLENGGVGPVVGFAVLSINGKGEVIAQLHMDDGEPGEYDAELMARIETNPDMLDTGIITLNKRGNGNAHLKGMLADQIEIKIRIGHAPMGKGNPPEIYMTASDDKGWLPVEMLGGGAL